MGLLRKLAYTTVGGGAILLVGGGLTYRRRLQENKSVTATEFNALQDQEALKDCLKHLRDGTLPPVSMYRYTTCPFCCKVKAFFDYYEVPHECVEVDPMFKAQLAGVPYKKVPQLEFHHPERKVDPMLVDSDVIVDLLAPLVGAQDQLKDADVDKWRTYARNDLVKLLVINLNATLLGAWNGYNYIDNFDTIPGKNKFFLKAIGGPVMYMVAKYRTTPDLIKQGLLKENANEKERMDALRVAVDRFVDAAAARQATHKPSKATVAAAKEVTELKLKKMAKEGNTLVQLPSQASLTQSAKLHGVVGPDLADLEVYGVLQSLRGHAIYNEVIQTTRVKPWIDAMDSLTGKAPYSATH